MPPPHLDQAQRMRQSGLATDTVFLTATKLWDYSPKEAKGLNRRLMRDYALEGTAIDILGELQLKYRQQDHLIDAMARDLKKEGQTASFYNVYRLALSDSRTSLLSIAKHREETGRNCFRTPEQQRAEKKEREERLANIHQACERNRDVGAFVHSGHDCEQAGIDLLGQDCAVRDIIRMRMLPKSPKEDWLLAELFDCLTEDEKKIDVTKLSDKEAATDLNQWMPAKHAAPGNTKYNAYQSIAKAVYLERLKHYNEVWKKAEEKVEARMKELGLTPRIVKPFVGLPDIIKRTSEGDEKALDELTELLRHAADLERLSTEGYPGQRPDCFHDHTSPDYLWNQERAKAFADQEMAKQAHREGEAPAEPSVDAGAKPLVPEPQPASVEASARRAPTEDNDPYLRDFGPATKIIIALFLTFTMAWTCVSLVIGQNNLQTHFAHLLKINDNDLAPGEPPGVNRAEFFEHHNQPIAHCIEHHPGSRQTFALNTDGIQRQFRCMPHHHAEHDDYTPPPLFSTFFPMRTNTS